jgi:hypothetical protein
MATTCFGPLVAIIRYTVQKLKGGVKVDASPFFTLSFSFRTVRLMMATSGPKHVVATY